MLWVALLVTLAAGLAALAGYASWATAQSRYKKSLRSARARWEHTHQQDSPGIQMESFTLGWLNTLVQSTWTPVLEKHVSALATESLQKLLNELMVKNAAKMPWKVIERMSVESVTFGLVPPQVQFCFAKYDPKAQLLKLSMDFKFNSSGFQALLNVRGRSVMPGLAPFAVRMEVSHLLLAGRLLLGVHLCKEPPGIRVVEYSFASEPVFDIRFNPVGRAGVFDLPTIVNGLRSFLVKVINKRMVEPARRPLYVQKVYTNNHLKKFGGPGGMVRVTVIAARELAQEVQQKAAAAAAAAAGAADGGGAKAGADGTGAEGDSSCDLYCELRFLRQVLRTPIVRGTSPLWNWQLDLKLPGPLGEGLYDEVARLTVYDVHTLGDPVVVGSAELDLRALGLQENSEPRPVVLPLRQPPAMVAVGGAHAQLQLQVSLLKMITKPALFAEDSHITQYNLLSQLAALHKQQSSNPRMSSLPPSRVASLQQGGLAPAAEWAAAQSSSSSPASRSSPAGQARAQESALRHAATSPPAPLTVTRQHSLEQPTSPNGLGPVPTFSPQPTSPLPPPASAAGGLPPAGANHKRHNSEGGLTSAWNRLLQAGRFRTAAGSVLERAGSGAESPMDTIFDGALANGNSEQQAGSAFFDLPPTSTSEAPTSPFSHRRSRSAATPRKRDIYSPAEGDLGGSPPQQQQQQQQQAGSLAAAGAAAYPPVPIRRHSVAGHMVPESSASSGVYRPPAGSPQPDAGQVSDEAALQEPHTELATDDPSGMLGNVMEPPSPGTTSQVASELPTESLMISREGSYTAASSTPAPADNPLATLAKVAKLQKLLDKERRAAAALQGQLQELAARHDALARLRRSEGRRALLEGASFQLHCKDLSVKQVHLWFNKHEGALKLRVEQHVGSAAGERSGSGKPEGEAPTVIAITSITKVEVGASHFPRPGSIDWNGLKSLILGKSQAVGRGVNDSKAFSLHVAASSSSSGGMYHLQLPLHGNGRSRDEWVAALQDLAANARVHHGSGTYSMPGSEVTSPMAGAGGSGAAGALLGGGSTHGVDGGGGGGGGGLGPAVGEMGSRGMLAAQGGSGRWSS